MSLSVHKTETFVVDVASQFTWYLVEAGEPTAWRFIEAVDATLNLLGRHPEQGRRRHFSHPALNGIRSFRVAAPFDSFLIFYRPTADTLQAWRLMHGARDLPRRLTESLRPK